MQTTNVSVLAQSGQTAPSLSQATLTELPSDGIEIPGQVLGRFSEASGLLVCEARTPWISVSFEVWKGDELLFTYTPQMEIRPVKEMYSWFNFRLLSGGTAERPSVTHVLADERNTKSLVFLHGANVSEVDAEAWGDALFKRLWLSGVKADFYNVDWRSNIGGAADYHANASNAFVVAGQIASTIQDIPGEKVLMAHSLGNMVVSSMIQDHHLRVSRYLMCNSAVPAEAYDPAMDHTAVLQHKDWDDYPAEGPRERVVPAVRFGSRRRERAFDMVRTLCGRRRRRRELLFDRGPCPRTGAEQQRLGGRRLRELAAEVRALLMAQAGALEGKEGRRRKDRDDGLVGVELPRELPRDEHDFPDERMVDGRGGSEDEYGLQAAAGEHELLFDVPDRPGSALGTGHIRPYPGLWRS